MAASLNPAGWPLATRVVAAAMVLLGLLLVIVVVTHEQALNERRRAEIDNAADTGRAVAGIIDGFAQDLQTTMLSAALVLGAKQGEISQEADGPFLNTLREDYGMLRAIFVTDPQGRVIASDSGSGTGTELADRPYMVGLRGGQHSVWGPGVAGLQTGEVTVTYGRAILTPMGAVRGYVIAAFYPPALARRLEPSLPPDSDVSLFDSNGLLLHSTQRPDIAIEQRDLRGSARIREAIAGATVRVDGGTLFFGGERRFGVVVPVSTTGWAVAYTRPLAPLEAVLRERLLMQAAQVAGAVLLVGAALMVATLRIARPLADLAGSASAVARGERPEIPQLHPRTELGQLSRAMSVMSEAVAEREDALRRESHRRTILAEASRAFAEAGLDLEEELDVVVRLVSAQIGDGCVILLISPDGLSLVPGTLHHASPATTQMVREMLLTEPQRVGEGFLGGVAQSGEPLLLPSLTLEQVHDAVSPTYWHYLEQVGLYGLLAVPLRAHGRNIGILTTWRDSPERPYTDDDQLLLDEIADRAALAIENARLFEEAKEHAAVVERTMRAHDELLAMVSHDLKNPLSTIKATAQMIRRSMSREVPVSPDSLMDSMGMIEGAADKATDELDASLDTARLQMGQPLALSRNEVDLVALIRGRAEDHQRLSERHRIVVQAAEEHIVGEWDGPRIERVIANLLSNAVKYSPDGGQVLVRVERGRASEDEVAVVSVRDQGMGIPAAALPRIFERFYRAENVADRFPGTGLGLSGARYIVEAHGGRMVVESAEGRGSTFSIHLPLIPPEEPPADNGQRDAANG